MPILVVSIVISLTFYFFYKFKSARTRMPMEKKWISGKSSIALGLFVALFGVYLSVVYQAPLAYVIAAIFVIIGGISIWGGYKMYAFYLPHAIREAESSQKA
jgi:hypothetical protein